MKRFRRSMRVLQHVLRRTIDLFPWTPLGLVVGACAAAALYFIARPHQDLVLLVLSYGMLAFLALAGLIVPLVALWMGLRRPPMRAGEGLQLETLRWCRSGFRPNSLRWLPFIRLRWLWQRPAGVEVRFQRREGSLEEEVWARRRGEYRQIERRLVIEDTFGLARIRLPRQETLPLRILPSVGRLNDVPLRRSLAGGEAFSHPLGVAAGDRIDLRRYAPGDPARFIHWKVFGRSRKLMVRSPERALDEARRTVAYLMSGSGDEASAAAARLAIEKGLWGDDWVFCADGSEHEVREVEAALSLIARSRREGSARVEGFRAFLAKMDRGGPAAVVLFAPPQAGAWLESVVALARRRSLPFRVVVGVDRLLDAPKRPWWQRTLLDAAPDQGNLKEELRAIQGQLAAVRCELVVLDRDRGQPYDFVRSPAQRAVAAASLLP